MKWVVIFAILFLAGTLVHGLDKVVRDRHGRILYREQRIGGHMERRDRHGVLQETRKRIGNKIYVRDRHGRLLRIERIK
jgi:hypothetical protein